MAQIDQLHARTVTILQRSAEALPLPLPTGGLEAMGPAQTKTRFAVFIPEQLEAALALAGRFMELANTAGGDAGLDAVLAAAEAATVAHDVNLVKYALMVFITHHPEGRRLPIPSLEERAPTQVTPSQTRLVPGLEALGALGPEAALDWFREDTWVNDHHAKWHVVYPGDGIPNPANPAQRLLKDRQGELFYYMHQQMLARYDTERLAAGLPRVAAFSNYRSPIGEGYDANLAGYSNRPPNALLSNTAALVDQELRRDRLMTAVTSGTLVTASGTVPITGVSQLAATSESTIASVNRSFYGSHHNIGHGLIANGSGTGGFPGVMISTDTAVRDPVFFRWHRHVDDFFFEWQQRHLPPHTLADAPPNVTVRKNLTGWPSAMSPDVLLCLQRDVPGIGAPGFNGHAFGVATFGGANWDLPRASFPVLTDRLETRMRLQTLTMPNGATIAKPYLDHEDFFYFLRVENAGTDPRPVTVRVFLAASAFANDRRMWIEMDKFGVTLPPASRVVLYRPARLSSVVRKPAWRPTEQRPALPPGTPASAQNYCDCGWPYHLLVPRGTSAGMPFRLLVFLTDWLVDRLGADSTCGSLSFCGARDSDYPDTRPMGYPFDRPFAGGQTIAQVVADLARRNIAARDLMIQTV
jgi:tyrosinase